MSNGEQLQGSQSIVDENQATPENSSSVEIVTQKGRIEKLIKRLAIIYDRRYAILDDDSSLLPAVKRVLEENRFPAEIGNRLSSIGFEHSIRRLGDSHVLKIACPETLDVVRSWVEWIKQGHALSKIYSFSAFFERASCSSSVRGKYGNIYHCF